jgi:hypothetical protein
VTLRERLAAMPPGALVPVGWLLEQMDCDPVPDHGPELVAPEAATSWRERLWTCPPDTRMGVGELTEAVGRPASWVYRRTSERAAAANGRHGRLAMLPHRRLGAELVFRAGEIRDWLREHEAGTVAPRRRTTATGGMKPRLTGGKP